MFTIQREGGLFLVTPMTDDVREWLLERTDGQWFGPALVVEHRYIAPLVQGLIDDGFCEQ